MATDYPCRSQSFDSDEANSLAGLLSEKPYFPSLTHSQSWLTPRFLSDFTIGLSDGLTVPFALTAGLSALGNGKVVVSAGLAELVAGALSMGIAGYLAAAGEVDAQNTTSQQGTRKIIETEPEEALSVVRARFQQFCLPEEILRSITDYYSTAPPQQLVNTLLSFKKSDNASEFSFQTAAPLRPWLSGLTIAMAYLFGGSVPLLPYMFFSVQTAFRLSILITATVLFAFGCVKVPLAGGSGRGLRDCLRSGVEMLVLGGFAATASLGCVVGLDHWRGT